VIKRRNFREGIALADLDHYRERGLEVCRNLDIKVSRGTPYHDPGTLLPLLTRQNELVLTSSVQLSSRRSNHPSRQVRRIQFTTLLKSLPVRLLLAQPTVKYRCTKSLEAQNLIPDLSSMVDPFQNELRKECLYLLRYAVSSLHPACKRHSALMYIGLRRTG